MLRCCLLVLVASSAAFPVYQAGPFTNEQYESMFDAWSKQHGKQYSQEELPARFATFSANLDFVTRHNAEAQNGIHTYTVTMNEFADLTSSEFATRLGYRHVPRNESQLRIQRFYGDAPPKIDWRDRGAVTQVKNQGQCGSCWAFSTTGSVEGANFLKTGNLIELSEQELVDCDHDGDQGCGGGMMDNAFNWIEANGGIDSESDYPYKAHRSLFGCSTEKMAQHVATVSNYTNVQPNSEDQLLLAVAQQPVSVAIEADQIGMQLYHKGVFSGTCGTNLDHGVLVVGYGVDGLDYWIVKNSWGSNWGEAGYIRLVRGGKGPAGQCGIASIPSFPIA